jgi:diacylglycerol kinase family enzyme
MITNSTSVGGFKGMTGKNVDLCDGEFEVTLVKSPKDAIELNEIIGFLTGTVKKTKMVYSFKTNKLTVQAEEEVAWTLDGEFGGSHKEVTVKNLHKSLEIRVPNRV